MKTYQTNEWSDLETAVTLTLSKGGQTNDKQNETFFLSFRLENGDELLEPYFCQVDLNIYEDSLEITEVPPLIAYIQSTLNADKMTDEIVLKLANFLEEKLAAHGVIEISKETGLFVCKP